MSTFETIKERSKNLLIYGGITAMTGVAMLGVVGSVFAQDESTPTAGTEETVETTGSTTTSDRRAAREAEYAAFLDALAVNLGVADGETVDAAIRTTMKQVIHERLAAGEISADLATELKLAIDSGEYPVGLHLPGMGGFGGPGWGGDHEGRGGPKGVLDGHGDDSDDTVIPDTGTPVAGASA